MRQDLRHSFRLLFSRPAFSLAAILPLALAIAPVASVITLVDAVLFRSLGLKDPDRLACMNYGLSFDLESLEVSVLAATSISAAGFVGTALALAGVFAVAAWRLVQQRRDLAIRIALGAGHGEVLTAFVGKIFAVSIAGAGGGVLISVWTANVLRMSVPGVQAPHPLLYVGAVIVVLSLVLLAAIVPARQILRIDPASLLRVQ